MKVYQTIHKYAPHIPQFEAKYGITDDTELTFEALRRMIVEDGYASSYVLLPALEHKSDEVFFTLWDYERLQHLWAKEHGLRTTNLTEIKLAQIKRFKPDVFYNMSPFIDDQFIEDVKLAGISCKTICWNGFIERRPRTYPLYNIHLTLHKPFVEYWHKLGLKAYEFQPGVPEKWNYSNLERPVDVLFYGQYMTGIFNSRNRIVDELVRFQKNSAYNFSIHLQYKKSYRVLLKVPRLELKYPVFPSRFIRNSVKGPIYGSALYSHITNSKIVVNAYGDFNELYKSNMRLFESIGHGAFLISERGNYPGGLEPDTDFYTYQGFDELKEKIEYVLANWESHQKMALAAAEKIRVMFSKEKQWQRFQEIVASI